MDILEGRPHTSECSQDTTFCFSAHPNNSEMRTIKMSRVVHLVTVVNMICIMWIEYYITDKVTVRDLGQKGSVAKNLGKYPLRN